MATDRPGLGHTIGPVFGLWLLATTAAAISMAAGFYVFGQIDGIPVAAISLISLGIPQGIILQRYGQGIRWWYWFLLTALGWLIVIPLAVVVDIFTEAAGGLNPETDIRGCLLQGVVVLAFVFGVIQDAGSGVCLIWGVIQAIAITVAAMIGDLVGLWVYNGLTAHLASFRHANEESGSYAAGFLIGMMVYGIITGVAAALSLRSGVIGAGWAPHAGDRTVT